MKIHLTLVVIVLFSIVATSCQTDRQRLDIGSAETIYAPQGMFPKLVSERKWATQRVVYYFKSARDTLTEDPGLALELLATFEWLANELRSDVDIPPHAIRNVMDARNTLRDAMRLSVDAKADDVVNQLYSMSKFVRVSNRYYPRGTGNLSARKKLLSQTRNHTQRLIKQILELEPDPRQSDQPAKKL